MNRKRDLLILCFFPVPLLGQSGLIPASLDQRPVVLVRNEEREFIHIDSLSLDLRLLPDTSTIEAHATLQARNTGKVPLARIPLQLSSTLRWDSISRSGSSGLEHAPFTQSPIATDTDHTGYAQEAVVTLAEPLLPRESTTLTALYSGTLTPSAERLELIGTPSSTAKFAEWDGISGQTTALRGFGNILWFPVSASTALLGDGNRLFELVSGYRSRQVSTTMQLHLTVESRTRLPGTVIFNGEVKPLISMDRNQAGSVEETSSLAQVDFAPSHLSFESPSLFISSQAPVTSKDPAFTLLGAESRGRDLVRDAAQLLEPLLTTWLGANHGTSLVVFDHPGQPFDDGALHVGTLDPKLGTKDIASQLIESLSHTRFHSSHLWMQEGLPQFLGLLWLEQTHGRGAALDQLTQSATVIALAEPDLTSFQEKSTHSLEPGQPLISTSSVVFFRIKAAAVWWQLRDVVGAEALQLAIRKYILQISKVGFESDPSSFQHTLESVVGRDLSWFFDDWVNHDRSLPDLSIASVTPRKLPAQPGRPSGYLVAVEVKNEGAAVAEVPIFIRSGALLASERLRVPAHNSASTRIIFEGAPESIQVNDGSVPELGPSVHRAEIQLAVPLR